MKLAVRAAWGLAMTALMACSGAPSSQSPQGAPEQEDPFYGVYWGMEASTSVSLTAFTLLETNEYLAAVPPAGPLTAFGGCDSAVVKKLRDTRSAAACVPVDLADDKLTVQFAGGVRRTWLREADGSLRPSNSGDTTIWSFRRAWRPTFTRLEGSFRRFTGATVQDGIGGSTTTSSTSALQLRADGTFEGSVFSGVFSTGGAAGSSSRSVDGTYEIDGFELRLALTSGETASVRFLSLTKDRDDTAPRYLYVEGFGFLRRQD